MSAAWCGNFFQISPPPHFESNPELFTPDQASARPFCLSTEIRSKCCFSPSLLRNLLPHNPHFVSVTASSTPLPNNFVFDRYLQARTWTSRCSSPASYARHKAKVHRPHCIYERIDKEPPDSFKLAGAVDSRDLLGDKQSRCSRHSSSHAS